MIVNLEKVKQKHVKKYILNLGLDNLLGFNRMKSTCYNPIKGSSYRKHHQKYIIKSNIESVWRIYKTIHPKEAWDGKVANFGLQYSKHDNSISYLDDAYPGIKMGQIIILNLKLFWGLFYLTVAHEVAEINEEDHTIKFCYMEGGAAEGSQWIRLHKTKHGFTEVSHLTMYKSKSAFRDIALYPRVHAKIITEFHSSVKRKAELALN